MLEIGKRIKECREALGMTQDELAQKTGYKSRSSINKIEKGGNDLPQSKIVCFAKVLNTTPAHLMGWDSEVEEYNKNMAKEQEMLTEYLKERFDNDEEAQAAYDLIIRLPMLNAAGINRMSDRNLTHHHISTRLAPDRCIVTRRKMCHKWHAGKLPQMAIFKIM